MDGLLFILLVIALAISVIEDIRRRRIPNLVTFPTMVIAIAVHSFATGLDGFLFSIGGLFLGMGLFMIPYMTGGMGAGDVKLLAACGAVFGPKGIVVASILVVLAGGIYGLIIVVLHPEYTSNLLKRSWAAIKTYAMTFQTAPASTDKKVKLPALKFALPIALGALVYMTGQIAGWDLFPELLGDEFKMFSIALFKGGTG